MNFSAKVKPWRTHIEKILPEAVADGIIASKNCRLKGPDHYRIGRWFDEFHLSEFYGRHILKYLIAIAMLALPVSAAANDLEAIWFGGMAGGPQEWDHKQAQITFQPVIIDDMIKLPLKADGWKGFAIATCNYYGRLNDAGEADLILNEASGNAERCPPGLSIRATRVGRDEMDFSVLGDAIVGLPPTPMRLSVVLRDLEADEMATLPDGIDVLGIRPGMSFADAEKLLLDRGFKRHEKSDKTFQSQYRIGEWVVFGRDPHETRDWEFADKVTLSMATVDAEGGDPREAPVVAVRRQANPGPEAGLKLATIEKALKDKYGTSGGTVYYDRAGRVTDRNGWCDETSMQRIRVHTSFLQGGHQDALCGDQVSVGATGDMSTGLARSYGVRMLSPTVAAKDYWAQIRASERAPIVEFLEAQEDATAAAPEL